MMMRYVMSNINSRAGETQAGRAGGPGKARNQCGSGQRESVFNAEDCAEDAWMTFRARSAQKSETESRVRRAQNFSALRAK
jgi:hypothetical protein